MFSFFLEEMFERKPFFGVLCIFVCIGALKTVSARHRKTGAIRSVQNILINIFSQGMKHEYIKKPI